MTDGYSIIALMGWQESYWLESIARRLSNCPLLLLRLSRKVSVERPCCREAFKEHLQVAVLFVMLTLPGIELSGALSSSRRCVEIEGNMSNSNSSGHEG